MRHGGIRSLAAAAAVASALSASAAEPSWAVPVPDAAIVSYRGLASFDQAGHGAGAMLYPAPSLAGFVAGVITHGILLETTKRSQRNTIQAKADEVLAPYRPFLDTLQLQTVVGSGIERMSAKGSKRLLRASESAGSDWIIESTPEFAMTQDRRAIVLDHGIALYRDGNRAAPAYRNVIRVVSPPLKAGSDTEPHWSEGEGERLKALSAALWAESVDIAIAQMTETPPEGPSRTVRYPEGGVERIERAEVLAERCDRLLIRTLRGELMSVPSRAPAESCK